MTRSQVFLLILSAMFLGVMLFLISPIIPIAPKNSTTSTSNPVGSFIKDLTSKETTIILTGDIMLGRSVMSVSLKKNDPTYPFRKVSEVLNKADVVFSNLENPIVENCPTTDTGFKFCALPVMVQGLTYAGIDIVNIANNHTGNYGVEGVEQTKKYLKEAGIGYVGAGSLIIKEVNGTKFGFLGFDYVDNRPSEKDFQLVSDSKKKVDVLIVGVHWGVEYTVLPTQDQKQVAQNLVQAGADVISGHHPHWVQSIDKTDDSLVYYSLGNFVFDQMWSEETKKGLSVKLIYSEGQIQEEKMPVYMKNWAQPEFVAN